MFVVSTSCFHQCRFWIFHRNSMSIMPLTSFKVLYVSSHLAIKLVWVITLLFAIKAEILFCSMTRTSVNAKMTWQDGSKNVWCSFTQVRKTYAFFGCTWYIFVHLECQFESDASAPAASVVTVPNQHGSVPQGPGRDLINCFREFKFQVTFPIRCTIEKGKDVVDLEK